MARHPLDISGGHEHVAELSHTLATELGDAGTAVLFALVSRGKGANLRFVQAD